MAAWARERSPPSSTPACRTSRTPLRDATTGMVDAGNWAVSASWAVPADAVSGVYIAKLVRQDGTAGENHIPFIVRDDSSHSDIVFQTADKTWQAYNGWGGANFYGGNGPATGQGAGRAYAVSYNRPIATRGGVGTYAGPQDYLFGAEYAAIYWLEQNGYDVSYMAGVDVDRYGSLLLNHKIISTSATTSTGRGSNAPMSRRPATPASTCSSGAATRSTGAPAGATASAATPRPTAP